MSHDPLAARELEWAINSPELAEEHKRANGDVSANREEKQRRSSWNTTPTSWTRNE